MALVLVLLRRALLFQRLLSRLLRHALLRVLVLCRHGQLLWPLLGRGGVLELLGYPVLGLCWVDTAGVSDLVGEKSPRSQVQLAFVDGKTLGLGPLAVGAVADDFGEAGRLSGG